MRRAAFALSLCAGLAQGAWAQDPATVKLRSPVVTVDQERLYERSAYGQRVQAQLDADSSALAAENRKIEAQLTAEERDLTDQRPGMDPTEFHDKAAAFDKKVVAIRKAQEDKAHSLVQRRDAAKNDFFKAVLPVLTEIVRERGAVAILESRAVVLSADQIDITNDAIARIDARMPAPESSDTATPDAPETNVPEAAPQE